MKGHGGVGHTESDTHLLAALIEEDEGVIRDWGQPYTLLGERHQRRLVLGGWWTAHGEDRHLARIRGSPEECNECATA